jgi:hypothetical protein
VIVATVGVGSASATVLCANNTSPCTSPYAKGTAIKASLKAGTSARMLAGFAEVTCAQSTISGSTATAGSSTETVRGLPASWETGSCNMTVDVIKMGELEIHHIAGTSAGTLIGKGSEVTVSNFGVHCIYGTVNGTHLGKLTGSSETGGTATIQASANMAKVAGGFLCANPAQWNAEYVLSTPDALNVKAS